MDEGEGRKWRDLGDVGAVGIEFVVSLAVGYYAGRWLDRRYFHERGWVTGLGALFGVILAFKAIWDAAKRAQRRLDELEREERSAHDAPPPPKPRDDGNPPDDRPR